MRPFREIVRQHTEIIDRLPLEDLLAIARQLEACLEDGKILVCGCGGSAADAQHFAAEIVGRFERPRGAHSALALATDGSVLTAVGNDFGFNEIFARQVAALINPGDALIAISTSGKTQAIHRAISTANSYGAITVAFTGEGEDARTMAHYCDNAFIVPSTETARIQECHALAFHILAEYIDASSLVPSVSTWGQR